MLREFKDFLIKGNIVDLAVAFVIGVAFAAVVNSLVNDLIMPVIAMIIGKPSFDDLTFTINDAVFRYGAFITVADHVRRRSRPPSSSSSSSRWTPSRRAAAKEEAETVSDEERRHQELLAALQARS